MARTVVVTGAGRGLGYEIVARHLGMKDRLYAYDREVTGALERLAGTSQLLSAGQCDIADTSSVRKATRDLVAAGKRIDILYNVAGVFRHEDKVGLADTDLDLCAPMYNINAVGPLRLVQAVLPLLGPGSVVVNISSEAGSIGDCRREQEYAYCMSKAAMNMGAKILSNALARHSVRVILVHPGWMRTFMGGDEALASSASMSPAQSAESVVGIALDIDTIPRDQLYMKWNRQLLPW
jgi:NAD(P)-dependent dehydrogenase (short-subunit alcohol dehydrogenase family)